MLRIESKNTNFELQSYKNLARKDFYVYFLSKYIQKLSRISYMYNLRDFVDVLCHPLLLTIVQWIHFLEIRIKSMKIKRKYNISKIILIQKLDLVYDQCTECLKYLRNSEINGLILVKQVTDVWVLLVRIIDRGIRIIA